jgi:glycosyltransferase involved in cell wall biosynthesis
MGRRNIACFANYQSSTGYAWLMIEMFFLGICKGMRDRIVYAVYPKIDEMKPAIAKGMIATELALPVGRILSKPLKLAWWCWRCDIHTIYLTDQPYYSWVYGFLRLTGVRRIVIHDHTPGARSPARDFVGMAKWLLARSPLSADAYIGCSPAIVERFTNTGRIPWRKQALAENGIDVPRFDAQPAVRSEFGIPEDALLVVSCSRMTPYKAVHRIVEAAALLRVKRPDLNIHFAHIGDGPALEAVTAKAVELGVRDHFTFLGQRSPEEVAAIMLAADIGAHASDGEAGLCLAILEMMAARLPVVAPDLPNISASLMDGVTGYTYRPGDVGAMAEMLIALADMPGVRNRLGVRGRHEVESRYNLRDTIASVVEVVRSAIENSRLPAFMRPDADLPRTCPGRRAGST